ncbi:hypothetical protein B0J14DRAFT_579054 [Halenospora varia]|nr:hypothetical protein B0J14DRAFT_579054 [Halenospora varia]
MFGNYLIYLVHFVATASAATCYHPDGSVAPPAYQPCHSTGVSMCCATNRTQYVNSCRDDGLCLQQDSGVIWRESCTDRTWKSLECLHLCSSGSKPTIDSHIDDVAITACPDGSYCCGYSNTACCAAMEGYWVEDDGTVTNGTTSTTKTSPATSIKSTTLATSAKSTTPVISIPKVDAPGPTVIIDTTIKTQTAVVSRTSVVSIVPTPTILSCKDPSWDPNPNNWADAQVDKQLTSWWASQPTGRTFVDLISSGFGDSSRGQHCGIGTSSSCQPPDCQSFQNADGPRWVYFVRISVVELNTLFNIMNTGIDEAEGNLDTAMQAMAVNFFPWKDSKTNFQKMMPWIQAGFNAAFSFIPAAALVTKTAQVVVESTKEFAGAGLQVLSTVNSAQQPSDYYDATLEQLGKYLVRSSKDSRATLEAWSQALFTGNLDGSGKSILSYMAGGKFTTANGISQSAMSNFYSTLQLAKLINEQWKKNTKTFVICANSTTSPCQESSRFSENGRICCLYRINDDAIYQVPEAIAKLQDPLYNIQPQDIVASSLHSYIVGKFAYDESTINQRVQNSLSSKPEDQFFSQGVKFQGVWTLPVCDVGTHGDWVENTAQMKLPCCCGINCDETTNFMKAARLSGMKSVNDKCATQFPSYKASAAVRSRYTDMKFVLLVFSLVVFFQLG